MKQDKYKGIKYSSGKLLPVTDTLTMEEALQIIINGEPFTITMRTPGDDVELIRGLLFSEDVLTDVQFDLVTVFDKSEQGQTKANIEIPPALLSPGYLSKRNIVSVSSCGMCGKTEVYEEEKPEALSQLNEKLHLQDLQKMFKGMREHQDTFSRSGGSHAAAAFTVDGKLLCVMEDIGRHNAVDKVIGKLIIDNKLAQAECMTVSGRISYEIVQKCFKAGMHYLAAVSAPSTMAVEMAEEKGMTLLAFCREDRATIYSHGENVTTGADEMVSH